VTPSEPPTRMRAEIEQQPDALRATLDALLPRVGEAAGLARDTRQVLFIARGTSDNAAVYGSYLTQVRAGRLATLASPSVATTYRARLDLSGVLAVALSQSGRTEEIVQTMAWAADCGARTLAITNGADSPLADQADLAFVTAAGVEQAVPATKTFTTQLAALAVLGLGLTADAEGATAGQTPLDAEELRAVPDEVARLLAEPGDLTPLIEGLAAVEGAVVSGRGYASSAALELALKLKEACYLHAMGLSFADLLHGPIAVVDADTLEMARSNVSNSIRELLSWNLIRRVPIMGDRRDHYEAETDIWEVAARIAAGRKVREIDPAVEALRACVIDAADDPTISSGASKRLKEMLAFTELVDRWYTQMLTVPRPRLAALMRLGEKIVSFLPAGKSR